MTFSAKLKAVILTGIAMLFVCSSLLSPIAASAKEQSTKQKYKDVRREITRQRKKIREARKLESATLEDLDQINRRLIKTAKDLRTFTTRLNKTRTDMVGVEAEISRLNEKIAGRMEWIRRKLRAISRYGMYGDAALLLTSSEDLTQLIRRLRYLELLAEHEHKAVEEFKKDLALLRDKHESLETLTVMLKEETERVKRTRDELARDREKKHKILVSVRAKKSNYESMLKDLLKTSRELRKIIRESSRAKTYGATEFQRMKGRLSWPVNGKVAIPYGTTKDPRFNTPVFQNGIYITTKEGRTVKAVHKGQVVYADWFKGYGQLVILDHGGGYHTLYANLSEIFLKSNDIIEKEAAIGKVGESGILDRASLYFEIRYKGKALNPRQWLH